MCIPSRGLKYSSSIGFCSEQYPKTVVPPKKVFIDQLSKLALGDRQIQSNDCNVVLYVEKQSWDGDLYWRQSQIETYFLLDCVLGSCH